MKKLNSQLSLCYAVFNGIFAVCLGTVEQMLLIYASLDESYCLPRSNLGSCEIKLYHFKDLLEESLNSFQCESLYLPHSILRINSLYIAGLCTENLRSEICSTSCCVFYFDITWIRIRNKFSVIIVHCIVKKPDYISRC